METESDQQNINTRTCVWKDTTPPELKMLFDGIEKGNHLIVKILLMKNKKLIHQTHNGRSALHIAALSNQLETVMFLVENGAKIDVKLSGGETPLYFAVLKNRNKIVDYLLNKGANPNTQVFLFGNHPLHIAIFRHNLHNVASLIKYGADINATNEFRYKLNPLHVALAGLDNSPGNYEIIVFLLINGAKLNITTTSWQYAFDTFYYYHKRIGLFDSFINWGKCIYRIVFRYKFFLDI
jgi:hypothetical protein